MVALLPNLAVIACALWSDALLANAKASNSGITVGAAVTMSDLQTFCTGIIQQQPEHRTRTLKSLCERISHFGGNQVRQHRLVGAVGLSAAIHN